MKKQTIKVNLHEIVSRAIDSGVSYGYRRAYKHTDKPDESVVKEQIATAVMNELYEVLEFNDK